MSRSARVLIVEDDIGTQQFLWAMSVRGRFSPVVVGDGRRAIAELSRNDFDVVLLDLLLPDVNGFEVLRHVSCVMPHLLERMIVVTGCAEEMYQDSPYIKSVFCVLPKPVDVEVLDELMLECYAERLRSAGRLPARRVERPLLLPEQRQNAS